MEIALGFFHTPMMKEFTKRGMVYDHYKTDMFSLMIIEESVLDIDGHIIKCKSYPKVEDIVMGAMHVADKIHFVCSELDLSYQYSFLDTAYTMFEYYVIMNTPSFLQKTKFYGEPINKDAELCIDPEQHKIMLDFKSYYNIL